MPPKKKSRMEGEGAGSKRKGKEVESDAPLAYNPMKFVSDEAFEKYTTRFKLKQMAGERGWKLDEFTGDDRYTQRPINWQARVEDAGLTHLVTFHKGYIDELVREFYSNARSWSKEDHRMNFRTTVRGVDIRISPVTFQEKFGIPSPLFEEPLPDRDVILGEVLIPHTVVKTLVGAGRWKPEYIAAGKAVVSNIIPWKHDTEVDYQRMEVMYALGTGLKIDYAKRMFFAIIDCEEAPKKGAIPFPGILTEIMLDKGVRVSNLKMLPPLYKTLIDAATINKSLAQREADPEEQEAAPEGVGPAKGWRLVKQIQEDVQTLQMDMADLKVKVDASIQQQQQFQQEMRDISLRQLHILETEHRVRRNQYPEAYDDGPPHEPH